MDVEGSSAVTLDNVNVTAYAGSTEGIEVGATTAEGTLLLDGGSTMTGGTLAIGSASGTGLVDVESAGGAILEGVIVTDYATADGIEVGQTSTAALTLDQGTTMSGGTLTIGSALFNGTVDVEGPIGATLDGVAVTMAGGSKITVDPVAGTLTVDDGTSISGGAMTIGSLGTLDVEAGSINGNGATFSGVVVTNHNAIDVGTTDPAATTLTLGGGTTVTGSSLTSAAVRTRWMSRTLPAPRSMTSRSAAAAPSRLDRPARRR